MTTQSPGGSGIVIAFGCRRVSSPASRSIAARLLGTAPPCSISPTAPLPRRMKLPPSPGSPPASPTTGFALGSAQYIALAAIGTLWGVHAHTRLLPPRQRPGAPLSGFSDRNRISVTRCSSLVSTLPAVEPTCHHAPPLSMPSRNGNAPIAPPSSASPALDGV